MIEQVLITTTADTSQAETQYVGLRQEISLLKKQLDTLEEGTKEYDATFSKLSSKMFEQRERMQMLKNSAGDLGQMLGNVSGLAGTVSQGFAGATAALSLFGIENENLLRTIQKVQAFESIARTLASLEDAPKKIKALMANIRGQFGGNNGKLSLEVNQGTTTTSTTKTVGIDAQSFKDSAESAEQLKASTAAAAGSSAAAAGNQSTVSGQLTNQIPLQEQLNMLEKESLATQKLKIDLLVTESTAKLRASVAEYNANEDLLAQQNFRTNEDEARRTRLDANVQANQAELNTLREYQLSVDEKITTNSEGLVESTKRQGVVASTLGKIWSNVGGIIKGIGIGLLISAAIYGVTKLISYFKELSEKTRATFREAGEFSKEFSDAQSKAVAKELGMLQVLTAGYNNLNKNKQAQIDYLNTNKEKYAEIGIEVDKIISGEITYKKAIEDTTASLVERAKQMGVTSLLVEKYATRFQLETERTLNSSVLQKYIPFNLAFIRAAIPYINNQISNLVAQGYGSSESILEVIRKNNSEAFKTLTTEQLAQLKSGIYSILSEAPDDFQETLKTNNDELVKTNNEISILEKQVTGFYENADKGGTTATTSLKTYAQLLGDLSKTYEQLILNNPFTPEEYRKNEATFIKLKEDLQSVLFGLTTSNYSYGNIIEGIEDVQIKVLEAERSFNKNLRDLKNAEAAWERDNLIREANEQIKIKKDQYKQILLDAKESLKEGAITQAEFDELSKNVSKALGDPLTDFTAQLNKSLASGVIDFDTFKSELNKFAGTDLTVLDPSGIINLGNLTTDQYNYLQTLLGNWEDYYLKLQESNNTFKDSNKATTEAIFSARATTIEKSLSEVDRIIASANLKVIVAMNARNTQLWTAGFAGLRSGYQDVVDEITQLQNEIDSDANRRTLLSSRIELLNEELNSEMITAERRIELIDLIKQSEEELTQVKATETEKRLSIAAKEQEVRDAIFDGINEAITDIDSIIGASYNVAEQVELGRLNKLYEAKLITQEDYTKQSEAISDKYTKKRLQLEIFTGTMSAIGSSIAAFQSAVESKIPYPYNLILAGISSAAAFGSVMASVAQLKSLSIGNTSVNPTSSNTGSSLNYSLNQQAATNERLMNSVTDSRVYVLESDITGTQATIKEIEEMSTF